MIILTVLLCKNYTMSLKQRNDRLYEIEYENVAKVHKVY